MPDRPRSPLERELEVQQKRVTEGDRARERRDAAAFDLWTEGLTQKDIAERLDRADRAAGGEGVTHGQVQKLLYRMRRAREEELVAASSRRRR
jgi:hypothetical protein